MHEDVVAVPLTTSLVSLDHAAYVASPDVIRVHSDGRWITVEDNRRLVTMHRADHEAGRAFTFSLLDPSRTVSLGCLYVQPLRRTCDESTRIPGRSPISRPAQRW